MDTIPAPKMKQGEFLAANVDFKSLDWLAVNFLGQKSSNFLTSGTPNKFSYLGSYLDFLVACHLVDVNLGSDFSTNGLFKKGDYEVFKQNGRDFVYRELMKEGMLKELHPDFIGGEYGTHLGEKDNKLFFNLVVDTLVTLTRIHRKLIDIDNGNGLEKHIDSNNKRIFSHTDLSRLIQDDSDYSNKYKRRLFSYLFQSGIPMSDKKTQKLIKKLEKIQGENDHIQESEDLEKIIKRFKVYGEYAPFSTSVSGPGSTHHPFFMAPDSKTYQMYEFMKITNGFDPLGCIFYEVDQTTDDPSPSRPRGVVRGHLEDNPYVWEMIRSIDHTKETIWRDHVRYKFMLAPIRADLHYNKPLAGNEMFFNPIIQARMYHLSQITSASQPLTPEQLETEFRTTKVAEFIDIEEFNRHLDQDKQIDGDRYLWEEFSQNNFEFIDEDVFGYDRGVFGLNPSTESERFDQFIEDFERNLDERNINGEEEWFRENLGQIELFENMQGLAERIGTYSPLGVFPNLEGRTPLSSERYFEFFFTKAFFAYVDGNGKIKISSIFSLLGCYDPFRYL